MQIFAEQHKLDYQGVGSLELLEAALLQDDANLFVVDGQFPQREGGRIQLLAPTAIKLIRQYRPASRIVLYSSYQDAEAIASEHKVEYLMKGRPRELFQEFGMFMM